MEMRKQTRTRWRKDVVSCHSTIFKMESGTLSSVLPDSKHRTSLTFSIFREFTRVKRAAA